MDACCTRFTAAEGGARLAAVAGVKNTLAVEHAPFVATRLLHEHAYMIRGSLFDGQQRSVYVTRASRVACVAYELSILTDLSVLRAEKYEDVYDWYAELDKKEVLVCTSAIFREILEREILAMTNINILILDSCHLICKDDDLKYVMKLYKECPEETKPRILGLTYPLFTSIKRDKCVEKSSDSNDNGESIDNDHSKEGVVKIGPIDSEEISTLEEQKIERATETKLDSESNDIKNKSTTQVDLKNESKTEKNLNNENDDQKEMENMSNNQNEINNTRDTHKELKGKCDILNASRSKSCIQEEPENIITIQEDSITKHDMQVVPAAKNSTQEGPSTKSDFQEVPTAKIDNQEDARTKDNTQEDSKSKSKIEEVPTPISDTQEVPTAKSDNQEISTTKGDTQDNLKTKIHIQELPAAKIDTQDNPKNKSDIEKHPNNKSNVQEEINNKSNIVEETRSEVDNEQNKIDFSKSNQANSPEVNDVTEEIKTQKAKNNDILGENIGVYKNLDDFDMYEKLEWRIEQLEKELCSQMDLAEDIDSGKRLSASITKPKELIIEYNDQKPPEELPEAYVELDKYMRDTVNDAMDFLDEHRYDPSEIYGEDLYEEFMNIPNPTIDPKNIFNHFLYVLDQLGPYAADKAAFSLLTKLEKLKIKVPYERHFLLLCLCTSVFVKIRCYADLMFSKYESDWTKIQLFCTPKMLRFVEILEKFQPPESQKSNETTTNNNTETTKVSNDTKPDNNRTNTTTKMLNEIENCDFITLSNKIEDQVNTYEANLKEIVDLDVEFEKNEMDYKKNDMDNKIDSDSNKINVDVNKIELKNELNINQSELNINQNQSNKNQKQSNINQNELNTSENELNTNENQSNMNENVLNTNKNPLNTAQNTNNADTKSDVSQHKPILGFPRRQGHRTRGRGRVQRNNAARAQQMQQNPDALCGIVFVKEALMAKILFMLIVDMSRCHPKLSYLCTQYCTSEKQPDCIQEPRECQRQARKQEDVLKKFRMHECNLLLATSALEEGIDLPRCNLVLRWDIPPSYRSYGLCRDRARAPRAACVLMSRGSRDTTEVLLHNVATYRELDQIISRKCGCGIQDEPSQEEENHADNFTCLVKSYTPNDNNPVDHKKTDNIDEKSDTIDEKDDTIKEIDENNDKNHANINNEIVNNQESKIENSLTKVTHNEMDSSRNVTDDNEIKTNDKHDSDMKSDNLVCNKCNKKRISVYVECSCVSVVNISVASVETGCNYRDNNRNKADSKRSEGDSVASVDMNSAIALINRYCGKLPSDTFTRLAPQWWMEEVQLPTRDSNTSRRAYICTLRLPLNCPVKYNIVGHPMPTRVLARRMVALQACRILHKSGELDDQLMPIGKENFKAADLNIANGNFGNNNGNSGNGDTADPNDCARPGTTKRRQYYFKRTAWAFTDCQPVVDTSDSEIYPSNEEKPEKPETKTESNKDEKNGTKRNMLYAIVSKLWCALPERYNTRGRRLHAPQNASQAIGILMARDEPDDLQIPAFPVYTRSGEVRVSVEYVPDADVRMSPRRGRLVRRFMRFVFAEVLRVRRRGMRLQSEGSTHNNYYIVPTIKTIRGDGTTKIDIDWAFLELIYQHTEEKKHSELEKPILWHQDEEEKDDAILERDTKETAKGTEDGNVKKMENPLLKPSETFVFDPDKYREAVVTPWYRNQDQPQFFLVAEICWNLTPDSAFPSDTHTTFRNYYSSKYGVELTQSNQPLLDVDHTSARLNLLTPRYVNRKGVALPVSSERTRRAKRDRLDQKQILVPELCRVHPFAAPLWFATVVLPCVLYRINALLIADEIRRAVAIDVGLGIPKIDEDTRPGFQWPPLDFGWSLAEVLNADQEKSEKKKEEEDSMRREEIGTEKQNSEEKEDGEWTQKEKEDEEKNTEEPKEKTINDILQEKEQAESAFEIGTWSNEMASSIPQPMEYDEFMEPLPPNLTFCTSASGGSNWCDPIQKPKNQFNPTRTFSMADSDCSYMSSDFDTDDSDLNSEGSDPDTESSGFWSGKNSNATMGVRIEYKTAHEAEAVDLERSKSNPAPQPDVEDDALDRCEYERLMREGVAPAEYVEKFRQAVSEHKEVIKNGHLIEKDASITEVLPETHEKPIKMDREIDEIANKLSRIDFKIDSETKRMIDEMFPYGTEDNSSFYESGRVSLENIERNKRILLNELKNSLSKDEIKKLNCFSMVDVDIDSPNYVNEKVVNVGFDTKDNYIEKISKWDSADEFKPYYTEGKVQNGKEFDFDYQPNLEGHPGPSPSVILQALTMSNANDGINLERLETIGDSFLKFAITAHLYCALPAVHEGKLSHMRSKQVSNLNLYRLGRNKRLGARMIASKFEPHDNWLPPCHKPPPALQPGIKVDSEEPIQNPEGPLDSSGCFIPYNLITQHSIPDKSIADCVEALIGAYLLECGPRGALLFMSWLGISVLPRHDLPLPDDHPYVKMADAAGEQKPPPPPTPKRQRRDCSDSDTECSSDDEGEPCAQREEPGPEADWSWPGRPVGSLRPYKDENGRWMQPIFGELKAPPSPLLRYIEDPEGELEQMLSGYDALERTLQYRFKDRSLLLQALTHASHQRNRLTDCYQRLEFLGDAILDYLITRHLYEDPRRHSPGALTDLRSALVNNTIFATLAARHGFHKYFRHMSPGLNEVLTKYVKIQEENGHSISEEHYLIQEDEMEQAEDVEVPKALGDLFESVAGAIFLDSGMSLGAVWKSYVNLMGAELEAFSAAAPKSPVRELLEAEPDTAKFGKPERLADGRRVRVCVEVFGRGAFKGVGRNYRIAKGTAARCALRHLRRKRQH